MDAVNLDSLLQPATACPQMQIWERLAAEEALKTQHSNSR